MTNGTADRGAFGIGLGGILVIVGIVVIGVIGYAMELAIRKIENWAVPWRGHE